MEKGAKIKDLVMAQHILGMKIKYLDEDWMFLKQEHYIKYLVQEYELEDGKKTGTPIQANIKLIEANNE